MACKGTPTDFQVSFLVQHLNKKFSFLSFYFLQTSRRFILSITSICFYCKISQNFFPFKLLNICLTNDGNTPKLFCFSARIQFVNNFFRASPVLVQHRFYYCLQWQHNRCCEIPNWNLSQCCFSNFCLPLKYSNGMHCQPCLFHFQKAIFFISLMVEWPWVSWNLKLKKKIISNNRETEMISIRFLPWSVISKAAHRVALEKFVSVIVPFMPVNALMDWTVEVTHVKNGIDFPLLMEKNRIKSHNNKFFCLIFCFVTTFGSWMKKWRLARSFRDRKTDELDERQTFSQ